jgi:hypothetical protein
MLSLWAVKYEEQLETVSTKTEEFKGHIENVTTEDTVFFI